MRKTEREAAILMGHLHDGCIANAEADATVQRFRKSWRSMWQQASILWGKGVSYEDFRWLWGLDSTGASGYRLVALRKTHGEGVFPRRHHQSLRARGVL